MSRRVTEGSICIACSDCGTIQSLPSLSPPAAALCPVCDKRLERTGGRSLEAALACSLATLILLFPASFLPLMRVSMLGVARESLAVSGVLTLWQGHVVIVAILVAAFVFVLPFVRFGLLSAVLTCLRFGGCPGWLGPAFRWAVILDFWAMPDVFLIGCAVGYSRVASNLTVTIGWGGICLIFAAFLAMLSRAVLDRRTVWRAIGPLPPPLRADQAAISCTACDLVYPAEAQNSPCLRCRARLRARKPDALARTAALLIAGLALYLPANTYPMSVGLQLGQSVPHRIVDGIAELYRAGLWPLGVVVFCASIAIPLLKLVGLGWLTLSIQLKSSRHLQFKTKLYRFIDEIGRWSNIDVFTIAVFLPVLQFGTLANAHAGIGATAFILVVVLTMLASQVFDPRMLWDAGHRDRHER